MITGPHVTLRRSDRRQICVKKKRLYLLTTMGIDPFLAIGSKVETYEIEGCLRLIDWRDRRVLSTTKYHQSTILDKDSAKKKFKKHISWAKACIEALDGNEKPLWSILLNGISDLDNYLFYQCGERSRIVREEIIQETFTLYVERVVQCKSQCCNIRVLKRMARGLLAIFNKTVPKY